MHIYPLDMSEFNSIQKMPPFLNGPRKGKIMFDSIKEGIKTAVAALEMAGGEEMMQTATAIKTMTEAAGIAMSVEAEAEREPFFSEEEAIAIAEEMAALGACPNGLTCEGEHDIPCNVCWVDYLSEARR